MASPSTALRLCLAALFALVALLALLPAAARAAGATSTLSGAAFEDANRNGVRDFGEQPIAGQGVYLLSADGISQVGYTVSGADGGYAFGGLADGEYRLQVAPEDWWAIRRDWAPTTTGSLLPRMQVSVTGTATANLGWRRIIRSTDPAAPISAYTGSNGLTVKSYDDVVAARTLYDDLMSGSLIGPEAALTTIRFDLADNPNVTDSSIDGGPGSYTNYHADVYLTYISWLDNADQLLFHEYGHAWSLYHAYVMQQDTSLTSYLQARGILGDARLDSSHAWSRRELIAEDYRQLFGTATARAGVQENVDLPPAADVAGLRDFLATTFVQQTAAAPPPPPPPPPPATTAPALSVSGLAMNPSPVKSTGTASFTLSADARVTLVVRDAKGTLVRTLLSDASRAAGTVSSTWDRKNASGQRVKSGTYTLVADAVDASGAKATASRSFGVS